MTWKFHVNDSAKGRYDMILGRDILTELGLNLKFFDHVIEAYERPFRGSMAPIFILVHMNFKN